MPRRGPTSAAFLFRRHPKGGPWRVYYYEARHLARRRLPSVPTRTQHLIDRIVEFGQEARTVSCCHCRRAARDGSHFPKAVQQIAHAHLQTDLSRTERSALWIKDESSFFEATSRQRNI